MREAGFESCNFPLNKLLQISVQNSLHLLPSMDINYNAIMLKLMRSRHFFSDNCFIYLILAALLSICEQIICDPINLLKRPSQSRRYYQIELEYKKLTFSGILIHFLLLLLLPFPYIMSVSFPFTFSTHYYQLQV